MNFNQEDISNKIAEIDFILRGEGKPIADRINLVIVRLFPNINVILTKFDNSGFDSLSQEEQNELIYSMAVSCWYEEKYDYKSRKNVLNIKEIPFFFKEKFGTLNIQRQIVSILMLINVLIYQI